MRMMVLLVVVGGLSACHVMVGTPSGIREMAKWQNGLVVTGKSAPNQPDAYFQNQDRETVSRWQVYTSYAQEDAK